MSEERYLYLKVTMPKTGDAGQGPMAEFTRYGVPVVTVIDEGGNEYGRIVGIEGVHVVADGGFMQVHMQTVAKIEFPED